MPQFDSETGRYLALLQSKIRQRGYSEPEIQERLGWGRKCIARLAKKPKRLGMKQVLLILEAIGMEPAEFFDELYGRSVAPPRKPQIREPGPREAEAPRTIARYRLEVVCEELVSVDVGLKCSGAAQSAVVLYLLLPSYAQEIMGSLFVNARQECIGYTISYIGTLSRTSMQPRGLLVPALMANAFGVVVFHTHPSGDPSPSRSDRILTKEIADAAHFLGLHLFDHIILGHPGRFHAMSGDHDWPVAPLLWGFDE